MNLLIVLAATDTSMGEDFYARNQKQDLISLVTNCCLLNGSTLSTEIQTVPQERSPSKPGFHQRIPEKDQKFTFK